VTADGQGCRRCPTYTPGIEDLGEISVDPIQTGAFVTPKAVEAYVGLMGCDAKPNQYGGGVLLRKTGSTWKVVRYDGGLAPIGCARFPYQTGTVLLVCPSGYSAQGYVVEEISAHYVGPRSSTAKQILSVQANSANCDPIIDNMTIEAWQAVDHDGDKRLDLRAVVAETHVDRGPDCADPPPGKTVRHTLNFLFDGVRFTPTRSSAPTVACLATYPNGSGRPGVYCPPVA
jgi:hypothetical protein